MSDIEDPGGVAAPWPPTEIVENVWQSGSPEPGHRWDGVVDLDGGQPPLDDVDCYLRWRIEDGPAPEHAVLVAVADFVRDLRGQGKRILIHCAGGMNRSGLVVAAALIRDGMPPRDAVALIRERRPGALNNGAFVDLLLNHF